MCKSKKGWSHSKGQSHGVASSHQRDGGGHTDTETSGVSESISIRETETIGMNEFESSWINESETIGMNTSETNGVSETESSGIPGKVVTRESPMRGQCEDCGTRVENGILLYLDTGEDVLVCTECSTNFVGEGDAG